MARIKRQASLIILGERIRAARKSKGMTQQDLADTSDTALNYMGGIERGEENMTIQKLCAICQALGIDAGTLVKGLPAANESYRSNRGSQ